MASNPNRTSTMKTTNLLTLVTLLGACSFAAAQDKPADRPKREVPPELIAKFDKDGDGQLSPDERKAMREDMKAQGEKRREEMLKKFDKDGDGKLSDEERKAMRDAMEAKRKEILEKYDADKDGKLNPDERKAAIDAGEDLQMGRGPGGPRGKGGPDGPPPAPEQ
jgi:Ca2+-binding EF-hand superfamily protein